MSELPPPPPAEPNFVPYAQPMVNLPFRDRRGGLTAFGIVMICMGALAGCATLSMPLTLFMALSMAPGSLPGGRGMMIAGIIMGTLMYGGAAAALIWTGIGSIRARRWVRPVVLVLAWLAVAGTIATAASTLVMFPAISQTMTKTIAAGGPATAPSTMVTYRTGGASTVIVSASTQAAPATTLPTTLPAGPPPAVIKSVMTVGMIVSLAFMLIVGLGVPALFIWFYRKQDVRLTLEHFDPHPRWTDGVPVPVLGIVITAALGAVVMVLAVPQQVALVAKLPGIGSLIVFNALIAVLLAATAWLCYRVRTAGWLLAVVTVAVGAAGWIFVSRQADITAQMAAMGMASNPFADELVSSMAQTQKRAQLVSAIVMAVMALAYLLWCRKFFRMPTATATAG